MLLSALVLLRKSLRDMDAIVPTPRELGARHVGYGAKPEHYLVVGAVLIASLAEVARAGVVPGAPARVGGRVRRRRRGDAQPDRRGRSRHRRLNPMRVTPADWGTGSGPRCAASYQPRVRASAGSVRASRASSIG